ncbi:hypothetical protein KC321_g12266 [Hortaea werneckii]|nr:hypothetical protein KC321_g12266 [Hortaea werneckii]KAI6972816.1 hypothetical protein KC329_g12521 [Hortaea werneckii]KAI7386371.1 hypothetical protein KC336_g17770 [Hortaea werneckii]
MVINGIYYNPNLAMQVLEANGWTNKFFSLWFSSIDSFTRVHDKKLSIGAITALLTMSSQDVPTSVQNGWPRLLQGIVRLFQTLPTAMKNREEAQQDEDFGVGGDYDDDEEEEDEWEGGEDWENEEEAETEDVKDESTAYLDFLSQQAAKFSASVEGDEEEDVLEEESLLETPLDRMEPYGLFKRVFLEMNNQDPVFYTHLTNSLSAEEQQVLRATVEQADRVALEQQQQQQMAAQAAAGGNPAVAPQMNGAS